MPGSAGPQLVERLLDSVGHLRACSRPGTSRRPAAGRRRRSTTASPISGWWSDLDVRHIAEPQPRRRSLDGHLAQLPRARRSCRSTLRTCSRCWGVSMNPPVPGVEPSRKLSGDTDLRVAGGLDDLAQRDVPVAQPLGVDLDLELPVALAPDRHVRHAGHAHQARPERPARDHGLLDRRERCPRRAPIISTRLDEDSGWSIVGGFGDVRQRVRLGEALLDELAGAVDVGARLEDEHDRRQAGNATRSGSRRRPRTPLSRSASSGTVISCSTSSADSPSASVWISAYGGVNSGRTSTGASRSCATPTHHHSHRDRRRPAAGNAGSTGRSRGSSLASLLGFAFTTTVLVVRRPALGLVRRPCPCREPGACTSRARSFFLALRHGQAADLRDRADRS